MITLPHAIFIYDETGNPVPVVSGSLITSGSRGFIVYGKDGNNEARNFVVDSSGNLAIQNPPNLDVSLSSRLNTLGQKTMSASAPVVIASDQSNIPVTGAGTFNVNIVNDLITVDPNPVSDSFSQTVVSSRYNQIEIAFDQTDPDLITDITVTKTNGGDAVNLNGQAVFSSGINTNGGIKAVSNITASYRPHAELYAAFTAIFTPGIASSYQRIGIYDSNNGFFVGFEGTSFGVTKRKGGVDTTIPRASFSEDTLLGAATSKYTRNGIPEALDITKDNLYRIKFGWLGAAPIVFEVLSPDGAWVAFHKIKHPNTNAETSINNPDLPMTLDVQKTAAGATNLIVSTACWAAGTTSDLQKISSPVTDNSLVKLMRSVLVAKKPNGEYTNIQATSGGNLKVSLEEIDPAVLGQETMANSLPVVLASNQTVIPVNDNSGSLTIDNQFIDANLSTLLTTARFTSSLGDVTVTPANYTVLGRLKDINDTANTLLTQTQFTSTLGEISPTPTANTVLGRLKDIEDEIAARLGTLGQKVMTGSTPVVIASDQTVIPVNDNSGSLTIDNQFIDANLSTLVTTQQFTSSLGDVIINPANYTVLGRLKDINDTANTLVSEAVFTSSVGEVTTTPTANTILGRLKDIHDTANTLLTEAKFTSSLGDVVAEPADYTVLARLKDIVEQLSASINTLGQKTMSGSTSVTIASDQSEYPVIQGTSAALSGAWPVKVTDGTNVQPTGDVQTRGIYNYITDGINNIVTVKTGSTSAVVADNSLVTALSPNTQLPAGTNTLGYVMQGLSASLSGAWSVRVTDGTNIQPTGDVQNRAIYNYITDGINGAVTVKTGSTSAVAVDSALVTAFSPNTQLPSGTNIVGGTRLYDYNSTAVRATTGQELKVAQLYLLGEFNSRYTLEKYHWDILTASNGAVFHNQNKAAIEVTASVNSGSSATLKTNTYFKYQCGFAQLCGMTLLHTNTGSANQIREWGYYDDYNGYFFRLDGTNLSIVKRSNITGTPIDTVYSQSAWTVDPLNGTGTSGVTLDVSKGNGYEIEAQCFGVGVIRFFIGGRLVHQLTFSNSSTDPAMQTISLPVQVKVYNTGASTAGGITFLTSRVAAQGLTDDPFSRIYSVANTTDKTIGLTETPILSIRPKSTFNSIDNRSWLLPQFSQIATQGYKISYKIILNANLSGSSWTSVGTESVTEYDISATSYTDGEVIYSHFIPNDDDTDDSNLEQFFQVYGRKLRNAGFLGSGSNTADTLTIVAKNEAVGNTDVRASISWKEIRV